MQESDWDYQGVTIDWPLAFWTPCFLFGLIDPSWTMKIIWTFSLKLIRSMCLWRQEWSCTGWILWDKRWNDYPTMLEYLLFEGIRICWSWMGMWMSLRKWTWTRIWMGLAWQMRRFMLRWRSPNMWWKRGYEKGFSSYLNQVLSRWHFITVKKMAL